MSYSESNDKFQVTLQKFESMIQGTATSFFDVDEIENIFTHYLENGLVEQAMQAVDVGKDLHPTSLDIRQKEAECLVALNEPKKALKIVNYLETFDVKTVELYILKAGIYSLLHLKDETLKNIHLAKQIDSGSCFELHISYAYLYENAGNQQKAIEHFRSALEAEPTNIEIIYDLVKSYEDLEHFEEGIVCLTEFIDKHPYSQHAWYNLGYLYNRTEQHHDALQAYDYALVIDDQFAPAKLNMANTYTYVDMHEKAIELYHECEELEGKCSSKYMYIGECYEHLQDYELAIKYYHKALVKNPLLADAWIGLGCAHELRNELEKATNYVYKAIEIDHNNSDYWYVFANLQNKLNKFDEAKDAYEKVLELSPETQEIWIDYSKFMIENGMITTAQEILSLGIKHHPQYSDLYYRLTALLLNEGHESDAADILENALSIDYEGHKSLFEYFPQSKNNIFVRDLIDAHNR